jgi:hypothetical protein
MDKQTNPIDMLVITRTDTGFHLHVTLDDAEAEPDAVQLGNAVHALAVARWGTQAELPVTADYVVEPST